MAEREAEVVPAGGVDVGRGAANLGPLLHAAARAFDTLVARSALADGACSKRAFAVLGEALSGSPRNQLEIGRALGIDRTVMVGIVDELEAGGLVERRLDPADRRARLVVPTADGQRRHAELRAKVDQVVAEVTAGLAPSEVDVLVRALTAVAAHGPIPPGAAAAACDEAPVSACDD